MKISITNLLLVVAIIAISLGWFVDRSRMSQLNGELLSSERFDERRNVRFIGVPASPFTDDEIKLSKAIGVEFMEIGNVLELLAVFHARNEEPINDVVHAHALTLMSVLNCDDLADLQNAVNRLEYDPRIIVDEHHPKHLEFVEFIDKSMARYAR